MRSVVVSQPMYFPWVGLFEQLQLADAFVFLDDVQFARGFINRVQYKTKSGVAWLTVPLRKHDRTTLICDLKASDESDWRRKHIRALEAAFAETKYSRDALALVESVLNSTSLSLSEMLIESVKQVSNYFGLGRNTQILLSSSLRLPGRKSELIQNIVTDLGGDRYITGHGGLNYLDHEGFQRSGIEVLYMDYKKLEYPQKFAPFTPFVTILDLIANCGKQGRDFICSGVISWREMVKQGRRGHEQA